MNETIGTGARRWIAGTTLAVTLGAVALLAGCGQRTDTAATTPPESAPMALEGEGGAATPVNVRWDNSSNCLSYSPAVDTLRIGQDVNFNSSVAQDVNVTAPAGCFSAAETTFVLTRGGSGATLRGYSAGSYRLTYDPAPCPGDAGGTGPNIIINEGR